jgi:hypothetical protein
MGKHQCGGNNNGEKRKSAAKAKNEKPQRRNSENQAGNGGSMAKMSIWQRNGMKENINGEIIIENES